MPINFGTGNLLQYDAKNKVLICRECKYAIQKSALESHLLRHKIYRKERQRLMSSCSQLALLDPHEVQLPLTGSPPVDGLPIISGYRCTASSCENLCASSKRMKRHWSDSHGVGNTPDVFARPVHLQTFFRGTKLRYFEVESPSAEASRSLVTGDDRLIPQDDLNHLATSVPHAQMVRIVPSSPWNLDLETLRYFHHFTTTTSLTLPSDKSEPAKYWQVDVVTQALRLRWLMCGLLAISASHLDALADDETTKKFHQERSLRFRQDFSAGWEEVKRNSEVVEVEEAKTGAQIVCIHRCCSWATASPLLHQEIVLDPSPFELKSFTATVQGCFNPNLAFWSAFSNDGIPEEAFVQTEIDLRRISDVGITSKAPPALVNRIRTLTYRMVDIVAKPDSVQDFSATLSAIDALVDGCTLSYMSDDMESVWLGMESWLWRCSVHFNQMVSQRKPAALIVLAHWLVLVERAEQQCWFLRGSSTKLLRQITRDLPKGLAVQSMVEDLIT
jgi:hypothetical protein